MKLKTVWSKTYTTQRQLPNEWPTPFVSFEGEAEEENYFIRYRTKFETHERGDDRQWTMNEPFGLSHFNWIEKKHAI